MKKFLLLLSLVALSTPAIAESKKEAADASVGQADPVKRGEAHQKVARDKKVLETKIREGKSPEEIHRAKVKLQTDRVEKNRQDYLANPDARTLKDDTPKETR